VQGRRGFCTFCFSHGGTPPGALSQKWRFLESGELGNDGQAGEGTNGVDGQKDLFE